MCTAIMVKTPQGHMLFGRTMDFSYALDPQIYAVSRGYQWNTALNTFRITSQHSFIGIGQDISQVAFADGVNDAGFAAAVLYFPGYARYEEIHQQDGLRDVAAIELVKLLLSLSASVEQAAVLLNSVRIVGLKDPVTESVAPLHWMIADKSGACMVIEKTADGLHLMNNPVGVLANSPDFQWHMTNLRNYMNVEPKQKEEAMWGPVRLTPFGQGAGTFGLPGDYTPPSRFIRAAYLKEHTVFPAGRDDAVTACFHVMESVSIPKGAVVTERGTGDYTQYTAFADISSGEYFFKTYDNSRITVATPPWLDGGSAGNGGSGEIISLGKLAGPVSFGQMKRNNN